MSRAEGVFWALDVTLATPCFVPIELDESGEIAAVVTGLNVISDECPPGRFMAVIHEDGREAVEAWLANEDNQRWLAAVRGTEK